MPIFVPSPETFLVEEIPAYLPQGDGPHTFAFLEKRDLTTMEAVKRVAGLLGVDSRDIGYAGMKDRHAVTRQWISVLDVEPETVARIETPGIRILEAKKHRNKLRMGHLCGNRFEVVVQVRGEAEAASLREAFLHLGATGLPNYYGHQRFGATGNNVAVGLEILRGTRREPDSRKRKLFQSAVQSAVFNRVLDLRREGPGLRTVLAGDILEKTDSGGRFICTDPAVDQLRVDAGEVVPTAPMPGNRFMQPPAGTPAAALEEEAMRSLGVTTEDLAPLGRALPGARRPVLVKVELGDPAFLDGETSVTLRFTLPAGSYATVLLDALGVEQHPPHRPVLASTEEPSA